MKKMLIMTAVSVLLAVGTSQADITVNIGITGYLLDHGGTLLADEWAGGGLMQLIWSTVDAYSASQISNPAGEEPGNLPNYFILWSGTLGDISSWSTDHDGSASYGNADVGGNPIHAGYIYTRVFESALPVEGTWYASSARLSTASFGYTTNIPAPVPDPVDMDAGPNVIPNLEDSGYYGMPLDHGQVTLVPEPSTMLLALAGVGMLVYRRFRK